MFIALEIYIFIIGRFTLHGNNKDIAAMCITC